VRKEEEEVERLGTARVILFVVVVLAYCLHKFDVFPRYHYFITKKS
jgi:hypothetical protein